MSGIGKCVWTLVMVCLVAGCTMHLDKPVQVKQGDWARSIYGVDSSVRLEDQARVRKVSTVDGDIILGRWARATALRTVDGNIVMGTGALCDGDVYNVDGAIHLSDDVRVDGNVGTLVGSIDVHGALVTGRLETVSGHIRLSGTTHVNHGILLSLPDPDSDDVDEKRLPVVVVGPGVVVEGRIVARRGGTLWVSRKATIGPVEGITVQWFDGAAPPSAK